MFYTVNIQADINSKIKNTINERAPSAHIGIVIRDLSKNKILYQQNSQRVFNFASAIKLLTFASLNEYYGADYKFTSTLSQKGDDYYLDIGDKADFNLGDLKTLLLPIKNNNINRLYLISKVFSVPPVNPTRLIEDQNYCYGANINRVHLNKNCIKIAIKPGKKIGAKTSLYFDDHNPYKINNQTSTIKNKGPKPRILREAKGDKIIVSGTLNRSSNPLNISLAVTDTLAHLKLHIAHILSHKIDIQTTTSSPKDVKIISSVSSKFSDIAKFALVESDNFLSDYMLAKFTSNHKELEWWEAGKILSHFAIKKFKLNKHSFLLVDGSGLSRKNKITPENFDILLNNLYRTKSFDQFRSMLAKPNQGTLKNRLIDKKIYAKTGAMSDASALVGYLYKNNGKIYSFVIVSNSFIGKKSNIKKLEEQILELL